MSDINGNQIVTLPILDDGSLVFDRNLTIEQKTWWDNDTNKQYVNNMTKYLVQNRYSLEARNFIYWSIDFFRINPNITYSQFKNLISLNGSINTTLANEIKKLPTTKLDEYIIIIRDLENFNNSFQANSFDPLNSPWIKQVRQKVSNVENWSNNLGPAIKKKTNEIIDKAFIEALKLTALYIYPDVEYLN